MERYLITPEGRKPLVEAKAEPEVEAEEETTEEVTEEGDVLTEEQLQEAYDNIYDNIVESLTDEDVTNLIKEYVDALALEVLREEYGIELED